MVNEKNSRSKRVKQVVATMVVKAYIDSANFKSNNCDDFVSLF